MAEDLISLQMRVPGKKLLLSLQSLGWRRLNVANCLGPSLASLTAMDCLPLSVT